MPIKSIKKGAILVARPSLNVDIFNRSVILITEHNEYGTVGLILNKSLKINPNQFFDDLISEQYIYTGGPVEQNSIFYIHKRPDVIEDSIHIINDIYWGGNFTNIEEYINKKLILPNEISFYAGYCGWSKNQLENELTTKEWYLIYNYSFNLFEQLDNKLWIDLMKKKGGENLIWLNTPADPSMN